MATKYHCFDFPKCSKNGCKMPFFCAIIFFFHLRNIFRFVIEKFVKTCHELNNRQEKDWDSLHHSCTIWSRSDFSIKLTDTLKSDLSPQSGWDNNCFCMTFWQNWARSENYNYFHSKLQLFSSRTILNESSFVNLLSISKEVIKELSFS